MKHDHNDIVTRVENAIATRNVTPHSRAYFAARLAVRSAGALALMAGALFVVSVIVFVLRSSGAGFLPEFGMRGLGAFLAVFPWVLLLGAVVLAVLGSLVAWMLPTGHRHSFLGTLALIAGVVIAGAVLAPLTRFHERALQSVREGRAPVWGGIYRAAGVMRDAPFVYRGVVGSTTAGSFDLIIESGDVVRVSVSSSTRVRRGVTPNMGDQVIVGGDLVNGVVEAFGVRVISGDEGREMRRGMGQ